MIDSIITEGFAYSCCRFYW